MKLLLIIILGAVLALAQPTVAAPSYGPRDMRMSLPAGGSATRTLCAPEVEGTAVLKLIDANRPNPLIRVRQLAEGGSVAIGTFDDVGDRVVVGRLAAGSCVDVRFRSPTSAVAFVVRYRLRP